VSPSQLLNRTVGGEERILHSIMRRSSLRMGIDSSKLGSGHRSLLLLSTGDDADEMGGVSIGSSLSNAGHALPVPKIEWVGSVTPAACLSIMVSLLKFSQTGQHFFFIFGSDSIHS
jgi:hypothetical protein